MPHYQNSFHLPLQSSSAHTHRSPWTIIQQTQITCYLHPAPHDFPPYSIPHHFCAFHNTFVMTKLVLNLLPKVSKHSPHQRGCTHMPRLSATALKKCDTLYCGRGKSRLV